MPQILRRDVHEEVGTIVDSESWDGRRNTKLTPVNAVESGVTLKYIKWASWKVQDFGGLPLKGQIWSKLIRRASMKNQIRVDDAKEMSGS